ncbi:MAG: hypothetical protein RI539_06245 [Spiribacter sp.]|nr:hypothetical protein [Spiribacter sp.]MDR9489930.1 hypothetical protein [Spiribacter sp.]
MAQTSHRHTTAINLRDNGDRQVAKIYTRSQSINGLSNVISRWLKSRRRSQGKQSLQQLDHHLLNDIGVAHRRHAGLSESQLAAFYAQPLGHAPSAIRHGAPAEYHAARALRTGASRR